MLAAFCVRLQKHSAFATLPATTVPRVAVPLRCILPRESLAAYIARGLDAQMRHQEMFSKSGRDITSLPASRIRTEKTGLSQRVPLRLHVFRTVPPRFAVAGRKWSGTAEDASLLLRPGLDPRFQNGFILVGARPLLIEVHVLVAHVRRDNGRLGFLRGFPALVPRSIDSSQHWH